MTWASVFGLKGMHVVVYCYRLDFPRNIVVKHLCFSYVELKSLDFALHLLETLLSQIVFFLHLFKTYIVLHRSAVMVLALLLINLNYKNAMHQNK